TNATRLRPLRLRRTPPGQQSTLGERHIAILSNRLETPTALLSNRAAGSAQHRLSESRVSGGRQVRQVTRPNRVHEICVSSDHLVDRRPLDTPLRNTHSAELRLQRTSTRLPIDHDQVP